MIAEEDEESAENENCYSNLPDLKKKSKSKKSKKRESEDRPKQRATNERSKEDVQPKQGNSLVVALHC